VVVDDLDVFGIRSTPAKADSELIVDSDAVLAGAIAFQRLQMIAGRHTQKLQ